MRKLIPLAIIGPILITMAPATLAKNSFAPGQLKKHYGSVPGHPAASGYAPGHVKHYVGRYLYRR
jgi:hypothetical protein